MAQIIDRESGDPVSGSEWREIWQNEGGNPANWGGEMRNASRGRERLRLDLYDT